MQDEDKEDIAVSDLLEFLPADLASGFAKLFDEISSHDTPEAKLFKALDNMEALISHNEAPLETWLPLEYSENLACGTQDGNIQHT